MRILILFLVLVAGLLLFIRFAPMAPERWHVDPGTAPRPSTPNAYLLRDRDGDGPAPVLPAPLAEVAMTLESMLAQAPRTFRLAGSAAQGHVAYVQRSRLMGFPDAVSIRLSPEGNGTRIEIFSRSRFGHSDAGVNRARVTRWMEQLRTALTP